MVVVASATPFYQRDSLNEQQGEFPIDFRWMDGWMDVGQSVGGRGEERDR